MYRELLIAIIIIIAPVLVRADPGEVMITGTGSMHMAWDDRIRVPVSPIINIDDYHGIMFFETDRLIGVEFGLVEGKFYLKTDTNPSYMVPSQRLTYCTNELVGDYREYLTNNRDCVGYNYEYGMGVIIPGHEVYIIMPHDMTFKWLIGAGAGGGGGSLCMGTLYAGVQQNESNTTVGHTFLMRGAGEYIPGGAHLCSLSLVTWQVYRDDTSNYGIIPTTHITSVMLSGNGTVMSQGSPINAHWYDRYPLCEENKTRNIRVKVDGTVDGRARAVYSTIWSHTCWPAGGGPTCYCGGAYCVGDGDFIVTGHVVCINEDVPVEGDTFISPADSLTLINSTIY